MHSIIYYSKSNIIYDKEHLLNLANNSAIKNSAHNITGFLTYKNGCFVQYFEGEYKNTQKLFELIKSNNNHTVIHFLTKSITRRQFLHWNMSLITDDLMKAMCDEYFLLGQFNLIDKKVLSIDSSKDFIWQGVRLLSKHQDNLRKRTES